MQWAFFVEEGGTGEEEGYNLLLGRTSEQGLDVAKECIQSGSWVALLHLLCLGKHKVTVL